MEQFYLRLLTSNLRIARLAMAYECFDSEKAYQAHLGAIMKEHREMVAAIREQDADRAEELGRSHANLARRRVSDRLTQSPDTIMSVSLAS
jgi:DNA-binding GntR family transcriptional regulator